MPGLYLPAPHAIHKLEPKWTCALCGHPFYEGERAAMERHVLRDHSHEEVRSHSDTVRAPGLFDPLYEGSDVEWGKWIAKNQAERPEDWRRWMKTGLDK
jgi:hypothetical protein